MARPLSTRWVLPLRRFWSSRRNVTNPSPRQVAIVVVPEMRSPKGFEDDAKSGIDIPSKVIPGRSYLLRWKDKIRVAENGRSIGFLCVRPSADCDPWDEYVSLYLNLVLNEERLLQVANFIRTDHVLLGHAHEYLLR